MVLVFWVMTSLHSGIFNIASATISHDVLVSPPARILPLSLQFRALGGNLHNTAYGVTWLGQKLPHFTTRDFALAPFSLHGLKAAGVNASVVVNTKLYRAELSCFAPTSISSPQDAPTRTFEVEDGQGCKQRTDITQTLSIPGTNSYHSVICSKYFIVWPKETQAPPRNVSRLTARFCKTAYYSQPVRANISVPDGRVLQTWQLGPQITLTEHDFNSTPFEVIVNVGLPHGNAKENFQQKDLRPFDISEDTVLSQDFRISQRGFPPLNSILAGIAVGGQNLKYDDFIQSSEFIDAAYRSAQQLFFVLSMSTLSEPINSSEASHPAIHRFPIQSIQLVPAITHAVQAFLGLLIILIATIATLYHNEYLPFGSDPNSIAFLAALASRNNFLEYFNPLDRERDFLPRLRYRQATLLDYDGALSLSLASADHQGSAEDATEASGLIGRGAQGEKQPRIHNVWPMKLKLPAGFAFRLALSLAIAALVFLDTWTRGRVPTRGCQFLPKTQLHSRSS